ncbi:LysR family transcriptional regulator [Pseudomonas sp. KNUC1026]|uniref:LysR family transcriptional regulator n=1 Tax=Pseudomonas sp. KNUC1026 TaxID=2893890 RepID=UPI001F390F6B|nr:LysR family transcriptional regulator [Pseudomonas sp. KNUC1026]UFH51223.1 LysR family transcriptional regulator [Pseudomonas sp. KNUC1026]
MEDLDAIRLFVEAAQQGGLSAAGRKLGLSPAAASARLQRLEAALSARLFDRTTRQLRLTQEGGRYLAHCQAALAALEEGRAALAQANGTLSGKIRIAAPSDFGRHVLRQWLDDFASLHPRVLPALLLSDQMAHLLSDDVDLVVRFGVLPDSGMAARRLADNWRVLCAAPGYLQRKGAPECPEQLGDFDPIISSQAGWASQWQLCNGEQRFDFKVPLAKARETNDGALARQWALDGHGIVLKSIWDVHQDLASGRLVQVLPAWRSPEAPVNALYSSGRYLAPRVRALVDFLVARFDEAAQGLGPAF